MPDYRASPGHLDFTETVHKWRSNSAAKAVRGYLTGPKQRLSIGMVDEAGYW